MVKLTEVFDAFKIEDKAYRVKMLSDVTKEYLHDGDTPFLIHLIESLVDQSPKEQSVLNVISKVVNGIKVMYEEEMKHKQVEYEEAKQEYVEEVKQELRMKEEAEEVKNEQFKKEECAECIAVNGLDDNCIDKCEEIKPKNNLVCPVCGYGKIEVNKNCTSRCRTCGSIFDNERIIIEKYFKNMKCYQCKKESRIELKDIDIKHIACPKCAGVLDVASIKPGRITFVKG